MGVVGGKGDDLRREHGRDRVGIGGVRHRHHGIDAGERRRLGGDGGRIGGEHGDRDPGAGDLPGRGHAARRALVELAGIVFGYDEDLGHDTSPLFFRAVRSSATSLTMTPLARAFGGS